LCGGICALFVCVENGVFGEEVPEAGERIGSAGGEDAGATAAIHAHPGALYL